MDPAIHVPLALSPSSIRPASTRSTGVTHLKHLINNYLSNLEFDRPGTHNGMAYAIEKGVESHFVSLPLDEGMCFPVRPVFGVAATFAHQAYTGLSLELQIQCAILLAYMFIVDDIARCSMKGLDSFGQKLHSKWPGWTYPGVVESLRSFLLFADHPGFNCLCKRVCDGGGKCKILRPKFPIKPHAGVSLVQGRGAEVLIHLLWPKDTFPSDESPFRYSEVTPRLMKFVNYSKHILSYYREGIRCPEQSNFVDDWAKLRGLSSLEILEQFANGGVKAMKEIDALPLDPLIVERVQIFTKGWIMLGIAHREYYLLELFQDEYL
ncbi:Trichodiene synthase-domain-containing protein [Penicillium canescens]|uniref:Trichodiene synthase-domain-containing protein n=1 Tax=Penicillium canescens TaxID=5083 RepID=UPI0026E01374|nr:Trichodiene synthase-domain-containing protein [Penicillium canescens]KAJ6050613.1 Trichodiene synthase-domain-containing protein [Penicillium canescens]KAJ6065833.1 Trichodiene synthase-domain-containing protein [Penicillium canescens]